MNDLISRQAAIDEIRKDKIDSNSLKIMDALGNGNEALTVNMTCDRHIQSIKNLPSAQPTYTDAEIQKMQDIEQAQLEKAFELGREDAKAEAIQRWIPCSERLPDKEGNYLMTAQPTYNHVKDIRIAHWSGRWVGYVKSEILAWMPLPEPYREEGK